MSQTSKKTVPQRSMWGALGNDLPTPKAECSVPGCTVYKPWDLFCPIHHHFLPLGPTRPERFTLQPGWLAGVAARVFAVAAFPLAAYLDSTLPLLVLALGVAATLVISLTRNFVATGRLARSTFWVAIGTWAALRIGIREQHRGWIDLIGSWAPLIAITVVGVWLWQPSRVFRDRRLGLNAVGKWVLNTILIAGFLSLLARSASTESMQEWETPDAVGSGLRGASRLMLIVGSSVALYRAWQTGSESSDATATTEAQTPSAPASGSAHSATATASDVVDVPSDPTPVQPARPPLTSRLGHGMFEALSSVRTVFAEAINSLYERSLELLKLGWRHSSEGAKLLFHGFGQGLGGVVRWAAWVLRGLALPFVAGLVSAGAAQRFADSSLDYLGSQTWRRMSQLGNLGMLIIWALLVVISAVVAVAYTSGLGGRSLARSLIQGGAQIAPTMWLLWAFGTVIVVALSTLIEIGEIHIGPLSWAAAATLAVAVVFRTARREPTPSAESLLGVQTWPSPSGKPVSTDPPPGAPADDPAQEPAGR